MTVVEGIFNFFVGGFSRVARGQSFWGRGGVQKLKIVLVTTFVLFASQVVLAQSTGTITGRVLDSTGGAVAGSTVTVTNTGTAITRTTVTNSDGLYTVPSLQPGIYDVKVEMTGFTASEKKGVTLVTDTSLTVDFAMGVAGVNQQVQVTGEAAMTIETTQSEVSGSLQTSEVQNLPVLNRNFTGLVTLVPGARPAPIINTTKASMGSAAISVGGGNGQNVQVNVDGTDNEDNMIGGPLQNYTIEGIQEFKLLVHEYGVQYGRTNGSTLQIVSKSGTNQIHGSLFGYGRNDAMTAVDFLANPANKGLGKAPFHRVQAGGSVGGPIKKDKLFIFGAYERIQQQNSVIVSPAAYNQAVLFAPFALPAGAVVPSQQISQPYMDNLFTVKMDYQLNSQHSLFVRFAQQINSATNDQASFGTPKPDIGHANSDENNIWSIVGGDTWVIGNHSVNQFTFQSNSYHDNILLQPFAQPPLTVTVTFPSFGTGRIGGTDQIFTQLREQFKDDFSHQIGNHSLKVGADFAFFPKVCICTNIGTTGSMSFFNDPAQIIASGAQWAATPASCGIAGNQVFGPANAVDATHCGPYTNGFQTPGAISALTIGTYNNGGGIGQGETTGMKQLGVYFGDDWKVRRDFTVNFGVRYDYAHNFYDQSNVQNNRTYQVLKAIGSPFGAIFHTPNKDFGPRAGFAWDIGGTGKHVLRAGFGIFFSSPLEENTWTVDTQNKPVLYISSSYVNSYVPIANPIAPQTGAEQLPTYVYGGPLPAGITGPPANPTSFPVGASITGSWINPGMRDPYNEQTHVGYTHQLTSNTVISADYTHILGLHEFRGDQINPVEGPWDPNQGSVPTGTRRLSPILGSVLGDPKLLAAINISGSNDRSQYNELIIHFEHRSSRAAFQASYTLARGYGFGGTSAGITSGAGSTPAPQNLDQPFGPGEWGPVGTDERHRIVLSGVFTLPWGVQISPILQAASARPYNLTAGKDCNGDGQTNDRAYFSNTTGAVVPCVAGAGAPAGATQVSINSQRGDATYDFDARFTKFFNLGAENRKLGLFAELYNITNHTNFGNLFNGNASSAAFKTPTGYVAGLPTSRQLQLGARFTF